MNPLDLELLALLLMGVALWLLFLVAARRSRRGPGRLRSVDLPSAPGPVLRSERYRLTGRPDELRELPDGRWIPVEWKSRPVPRGGPPWSHRIQLWAYCLLLEENLGRAPPFGRLRYGDGTVVDLPWDASARRELLSLRAGIEAPYDGRARPSPARCRRCRYRGGCDVRAA
ncbi:MAG: PD-(D/E)XK nuclease family protein [Thermoplasmata archaeon]|nr:PD-(D/E)XK nuclease family protein [Thermoplasmata archaeon]